MPNGQNKSQPKHLGRFWPIFIIVVVSMVAGAVVYAFAYGNILQDEADSISFWPHFSTVKSVHNSPTTTKASTKTPVKK